MAEIVETEETENGQVFTVVSKRGERHVLNVSALAEAWVDFQSDLKNEKRQGWELSASWYGGEIRRVKSRSEIAAGSRS